MWLQQQVILLIIISFTTAITHNTMENTTIQEAMHRFLNDNGFKYIYLVENSTSLSTLLSSSSVTKVNMAWTILRGGTSYMQALTMDEYIKTYIFKFQDVVVFIMDINKDNITTFLHAITQAPMRSSILCIKSIWTDSQESYFKRTLNKLKLDSLFYLAVSRKHKVKWYQVITLKSGYAMTELKFSLDTFQIIEDYDLNGLTIYSISYSSTPYIALQDCDQDGKQCKSSGYLKDYTDVIAQQLNFTYESHSQVDGDWGILPQSGPFNHSGIWGGVMGKIVNAKYDMTISDWAWLRERYGLMSFVTVNTYTDIIMWTSTNMEIDFGLLVRPFSPESWLAIVSLYAIITICIFITQYGIPYSEDTNSQQIIVTTLWYFFVVLSAFYGGAMTMFFTSSNDVDFQHVTDVIHAYPDWKLVIYSGSKAKFALKAEYDKDYAEFWARVQASPHDSTYNSIEEGLSLIAEYKIVMQTSNNKIKAHLTANPIHDRRLKSLVTQKNIQNCIAFPFNSPLRYMFSKAVLQARESGLEGNLIKQWMGANINFNNAGMVENTKIGAGQLILVFVGMIVAFSTCFVFLCAELVITRMQTNQK
jgi:hypothetical protein